MTVKTDSLVERAIYTVRNHIRSNQLKVGDDLPGEVHFATTLGVSRAVMREAFGALAALKLIDVGNGRRARVGAIDGSVLAASLDHAVSTHQITVADVWDVRRSVEIRTAALAAEKRTDEEAEKIIELVELMRESSHDQATMTRYDIAFHEAIADATKNQLFSQMARSFEPLMEVAVPKAWQTRAAQSHRDLMVERHMDVAKAIKEQNPVTATLAMEAHFDMSIGDLLRREADKM